MGSINGFDKNGTWYLFLPAFVDRSSLQFAFRTGKNADLLYGGEALTNGEATDIFANDNVALTCNGKTANIVVLSGSSAAINVSTVSGSLKTVNANKDNKEAGSIVIADADGAEQYNGDLSYIKGRGNSTWNANKKPYNIKLDKSADLFGMGASKKWCLLANAADSSLVRNMLAYDTAQELGVDITSDTVLVDMYENGNYIGVYTLTEKVEIGKNRVGITNLEKATEKANDKDLEEYKLAGDQKSQEANSYQYVDIPNNPEDITGGYLLELEKIYRYPAEASGFITSRKQAVVVKSPEYATKAEVEYIRDYFQKMEDANYSPTGYNSDGKYYTEYLDIDSIARMYIVQEFMVNFDGCSSSFYLYKDVGGKICAGPAWDFDIAMGTNPDFDLLINNTTKYGDPESLYIQHCYINQDNKSYKSFLAQLFTHEDFQQKVQEIWNNEFADVYASMQSKLDDWSNAAEDTVYMNSIRWGTFGNNRVQAISSYHSAVNYVKNFAATRYEFLSNAYSPDTYFVKYDIGQYGKNLIQDTNIYAANAQATVKSAPVAKDGHTFLYWSTNPDGSGIHYKKGDKISVTSNINLYAQWG